MSPLHCYPSLALPQAVVSSDACTLLSRLPLALSSTKEGTRCLEVYLRVGAPGYPVSQRARWLPAAIQLAGCSVTAAGVWLSCGWREFYNSHDSV